MRYLSSAIAFGAVIASASDGSARSFRVEQIPNGRSWTCDSCHGRAGLTPDLLTPFGRDVYDTLDSSDVVWSVLWQLDSDGDGFTNGHELGDPDGAWRRGDPNPDQPTSNPGVPNEGICGNADAEPDEDCDGADLRGETCQSLGFGQGELTCHSLCRWDTRECGFCGDGFANPAFEDCDKTAFAEDVTCEDFGFTRGELSCTDDCKVDPVTCTDEAPAVCGDGIISTGELCDGTNLGTIDCVRIAYAGGTLVCTDDCRWDASDCRNPDGTRVGDEERAAADDGSTGPDGGAVAPQHDAGDGVGYGVDDGGSVDAGETAAVERTCATAGGGGPPLFALLLAVLVVVRRPRKRRLGD